jgi:iron only hydrogenase large subunit-like protein
LKLFNPLVSNNVFVAVSPQTISSLTAYYQTKSDFETFRMLQETLKNIGVKQVYDLSYFNSLALHLSYHEFKERLLQSPKESTKKGPKYNYHINLPILTSECPGWVCYAEKTVGDEAIPFMSKVKSP